tara:strand:- start:244 stop:441 length:198 start_codon:yes stop_codon:yes gene_type:complete
MFEVGDLVRRNDSFDKKRQLGMITKINEKVHIRSSGLAAIVMVYWFLTEETEIEYTFFLEKLDKQ